MPHWKLFLIYFGRGFIIHFSLGLSIVTAIAALSILLFPLNVLYLVGVFLFICLGIPKIIVRYDDALTHYEDKSEKTI